MLPIIIFQIHIQSEQQMDFGDNPGSSIRGAFYEALRILYDDGSDAQSVHEITNPVAWLMRLEDNSVKGGEGLPRPFGIQPPLQNKVYEAQFSVTLYGKACDYSLFVLSAINTMPTLRLGRGKWNFRIKTIYQIDPITHIAIPTGLQAGALQEIRTSPNAETYFNFAKLLKPDVLNVRFITPTRIIHDGRLCDKPLFASWIGRLLSRIRKLSELYIEQAIEIPFVELLSSAKYVEIENDETAWQDTWSFSQRDAIRRPTSGFTGWVQYRGPLVQFLPYLIFGQALQVGKNIVKGCGWYQLYYDWQ